MIFSSNKYTHVYYRIINRALSRDINGYFEKHHVIPKSLGGSNDCSNIVKLTAKEHYICHLLLIKMTVGKNKTKMRYAAYMFAKSSKLHTGRLKITGSKYQKLKEQMVIANKERPGPNLGKCMSEEQKNKISSSLKGKNTKPKTAEHRKKISLIKLGQKQSQETKDKRAQSLIGGKRSVETKLKMSEWQKGVSKPKIMCKHCKKETSLPNHKRWHGDNCKMK